MKTAVRIHRDRFGRVWQNTFGNMWESQKPNKAYDVTTPAGETFAVTGTSSTLKHVDDIFW